MSHFCHCPNCSFLHWHQWLRVSRNEVQSTAKYKWLVKNNKYRHCLPHSNHTRDDVCLWFKGPQQMHRARANSCQPRNAHPNWRLWLSTASRWTCLPCLSHSQDKLKCNPEETYESGPYPDTLHTHVHFMQIRQQKQRQLPCDQERQPPPTRKSVAITYSYSCHSNWDWMPSTFTEASRAENCFVKVEEESSRPKTWEEKPHKMLFNNLCGRNALNFTND